MSLKAQYAAIFLSFTSALALAACGSPAPAEPVAILPDAPDPTPFTRAYTLVESPDASLRIFAREARDDTNLFLMRRQEDGSWSAPEEMDLPHIQRITSPAFDPAGAYLYYASDQPIESLSGRKELNIWRVPLTDDGFGEPEFLPDQINTGAVEKVGTIGPDGTLYFITDHPRGGSGGLDIMRAVYDEAVGLWQVSQMPAGFNDARADDHFALTPDGRRAFFYSHRSPKIGVVDIWTSTLEESGDWSVPVNLGPPVNTAGIDYGAGVSADGETLFFSREGRLMEIPLSVALAGEGWTSDEAS